MKRKKTTTDAVRILDKTFIKGRKKRLSDLKKIREDLQIAEQIYTMRTQAGLSQKDLADIVGTTQSVISRLEDADYGRHSLRMLNRVAAALHCRVEVRLVPETAKYACA
jgi:ribosome-binding protein aMBF1 (putative translation factor)